MNKFLVVFLCAVLFSFSVYAQSSSSKNVSAKVTGYTEILGSIDQVRQLVVSNNLSQAINVVSVLLTDLQNEHKKALSGYFPLSFGEFTFEDVSESTVHDVFGNEEFGVLFARQYVNTRNHTIDVSVVFSDPSIKEYLRIVKKPQLAKELYNAEVIKVKGTYMALEKFFPADRFCERTIIIDKELLLNIVANGVSSKEDMDALIDHIDFNGLDSYLLD